MLFNSLSYCLFLPVVLLLFSIAGSRWRWAVLLFSSYVFYGFLLKSLLLIVLTLVILMTFWIGRRMGISEVRPVRCLFLWVGIVFNLMPLVYMKYLPFLAQNLNFLMRGLRPGFVFEVPAPMVSIGLSFFIFQAISYLADIYFRIAEPERHLGYFSLYLAFFPKLLQGPIERAGDLLPQLKIPYVFHRENMRYGCLLFVWGLFKKIVIADRLGFYVDSVYNDVPSATGLPLIVATCAYAFQIYMDFSGYTDMALGSARLFNINLTQNFNSPYLATSVADFWRRWHISFSRWIFDYVFEPLQMQWRDWAKWGTAAALLVTFLVSGVWHGARWGFVIWGLLHGVYLVGSFFYRPLQKRWHKALGLEKSGIVRLWQRLVTFALVSFAWIFFRANSLSDAWHVVTRMLRLDRSTAVFHMSDYANLSLLAIGGAFFMCTLSLMADNGRRLFRSHLRWVFYYMLFFMVIFLGTGKATFIYFQF